MSGVTSWTNKHESFAKILCLENCWLYNFINQFRPIWSRQNLTWMTQPSFNPGDNYATHFSPALGLYALISFHTLVSSFSTIYTFKCACLQWLKYSNWIAMAEKFANFIYSPLNDYTVITVVCYTHTRRSIISALYM